MPGKVWLRSVSLIRCADLNVCGSGPMSPEIVKINGDPQNGCRYGDGFTNIIEYT